MSFDLTIALASVSTVVTPSPSPAPTIDPARVTPGLLGLASLIFLVVVGFLLARSMTKQVKRIDFVEEPDPASVEDSARDQSPTP